MLVACFKREADDTYHSAGGTPVGQDHRATIPRPLGKSRIAVWTNNIRQLTFRTSQRRNDVDSAAGIIAAAERDLLSIGGPVGAADKSNVVVSDLDRIAAANKLNIEVGYLRAGMVPEKCQPFTVR